MKKYLTSALILSASILTLTGCQTKDNSTNSQPAYHNLMTKADHAVKQHNYAAADAYYQAAGTVKKGDQQANTKQRQAHYLKLAQSYQTDYHFADAKNALTKAKQIDAGSPKLHTIAQKQLTKIKHVQAKRQSFSQQLEQIEQANDHNQFNEAYQKAVKLLKTNEFHQKYYSDLYKQTVEILLNSSQKLQQKTGTTTANNTNAAIKSSGNATDATNNQSANSASAAPGETDIVKNKTANGKQITAADIQKARQELSAQGIQEKAASDSDIIRAIQKAAADGRSKVTPKDIDS